MLQPDQLAVIHAARHQGGPASKSKSASSSEPAGKNRDAHEDFDKAISITGTNSKFFHSKGLAYQDAEDYDNAIKQFEMALDISPEHVPSIFHLGLMQHKKGKLNDSLESFT